MCGIYCELCRKDKTSNLHSDASLKRFLNCRGPDSQNSLAQTIVTDKLEWRMELYSTVLWMQGETLTSQPVENEKGVLIYNGDIFDSTWNRVSSDTIQIMQMLTERIGGAYDDRKTLILEAFTKLKGPYSLIFYDKVLKVVFFCRDIVGRNSLLFYNGADRLIMSSVLGRNYEGTVEVPASHVFTLNLQDSTISCHDRITFENIKTCSLDSWVEDMRMRQSLSDDLFPLDAKQMISPGIEDMKLIDFIESTCASTKCKFEAMKAILENETVFETVNRLTSLLKESLRLRLEAQPHKCKRCLRTEEICTNHCTVGVLFSGGLDCTILALLSDDYLPKDQSIDLINVAFKGGSYEVPDRLSGRHAFDELKSLRPDRKWILREVNVSEEELRREQDGTIADLVYPRRTILDESLGSALWFAARASQGDFISSCRVLLLGSGADELFGGYTRHRNALKRRSWSGLGDELSLDWQRISYRNLARDDRVIAHHGRQPRMPYLDEDFTAFVLRLKPWLRCVPSDSCGPGLGDKLFLRLVAFKLGLREVAGLPKRALQFGTRIANKKENGADISERFAKKIVNSN